jgi:pantoate--beta-alanine ligase
MQIVRTVAELRRVVAAWKAARERVALVPTMGALHEGHLALARLARQHAQRTIATIFVNPKQFNDPKDLANYPRTEAKDEAMLRSEGVDLIFAPSPAEMYPDDFSTTVIVSQVSEGLCGAYRPGHFEGVATVVTKLFNQSQADAAVFGEKDFQQLQVIRRMVRDLNIPIEIVPSPTLRESDGLAMSSRNQRLTPEARRIAPAMARALIDASEKITAGNSASDVIKAAREAIVAAGFAQVEYFELRAEDDLKPLERASEPARLLAAAHLGPVRLIDNVPVRRA